MQIDDKLAAAGIKRADLPAALAACRAGFGRDVVDLAVGHRVSATDMWDRHGAIDVYPHLDLRTLTITDPCVERRAYYRASQAALVQMMMHGLRDRSGTHFRWAAAMIEELATDRHGSPTWRAMTTESRYTEWRDRCDAVYQCAVDACRSIVDETLIELTIAARMMRGEHSDAACWMRAPIA
jgi:hypothetical protein